MPDLSALELLLRAPSEPAPEQVQKLWQALPPDEQQTAGAMALSLGRPRLALAWSTSVWVQAPARLRLGEANAARALLTALPDSARRAVLWARAAAQLAQTTRQTQTNRQTQTTEQTQAPAYMQAQAAQSQARREGDAAALGAAVTLLGELELAQGAPRQALRTLAEGLKVAELTGQGADPHLLAVLAHVQARVGSPVKARQTAQRALERSAPRGPARVLALLALGQGGEARQEAQAGELAAVWWAFLGPADRTTE